MTVKYKRLANNKYASIDNGEKTNSQLEKENRDLEAQRRREMNGVASDDLIVSPIEIDLGYKELIVYPLMSGELTTTSEDITE